MDISHLSLLTFHTVLVFRIFGILHSSFPASFHFQNKLEIMKQKARNNKLREARSNLFCLA